MDGKLVPVESDGLSTSRGGSDIQEGKPGGWPNKLMRGPTRMCKPRIITKKSTSDCDKNNIRGI